MAKCSECGGFKVEHYSDDEVEYLVCPDCDSTFSVKTGEKLSDSNCPSCDSKDFSFGLCNDCGYESGGKHIHTDKTSFKKRDGQKEKSGWHFLNYISGMTLVILIALTVIGIWVPVDTISSTTTSNLSDLESTINTLKICSSALLIDLLVFILSSMMIHKSVE